MKSFTLLALVILAISVSALKINSQPSHLRQNDEEHMPQNIAQPSAQNQGDHPWGGDHPNGKWRESGHPRRNYDWRKFSSPCAKDNMSCWQEWLKNQLQCSKDDKKCWGQKFRQLPCPLRYRGLKCWTDHISTFPCQADDKTCWNTLTKDSLPCKFGDKQCWKSFRGDKKGKGIFNDAQNRPVSAFNSKTNHQLQSDSQQQSSVQQKQSHRVEDLPQDNQNTFEHDLADFVDFAGSSQRPNRKSLGKFEEESSSLEKGGHGGKYKTRNHDMQNEEGFDFE